MPTEIIAVNQVTLSIIVSSIIFDKQISAYVVHPVPKCLAHCRLARYKRELITPKSGGGGTGEGFDVAKTGDARIGFVGFPSVSELQSLF